MPQFKTRSTRLELIDDPNFPEDRVDRTFRDMARLNRTLGGYWAMVAWLRNQIRNNSQRDTGQRLQVADLGCGNGDFIRHVHLHHPDLYKEVDFIAVDENPKALAKIPVPVAHKVEQNLMDYIQTAKPDLVVLSLVTHHLPDEVIIELVSAMNRNVTTSWLVVDLERHPLSWLGIAALSRLFFMEPAVIHDGPLSVQRGFSKRDWLGYLDGAAEGHGWHHSVISEPLFRWKITGNRLRQSLGDAKASV